MTMEILIDIGRYAPREDYNNIKFLRIENL
jgi:hypothetical protein